MDNSLYQMSMAANDGPPRNGRRSTVREPAGARVRAKIRAPGAALRTVLGRAGPGSRVDATRQARAVCSVAFSVYY